MLKVTLTFGVIGVPMRFFIGFEEWLFKVITRLSDEIIIFVYLDLLLSGGFIFEANVITIL